jgi:hypothetical protein
MTAIARLVREQNTTFSRLFMRLRVDSCLSPVIQAIDRMSPCVTEICADESPFIAEEWTDADVLSLMH